MVGGWDLFRGSHKALKRRRKEREGVLIVSTTEKARQVKE